MFWLLVPLQLTPECFFEKFSTFNLGSLTTGVHMIKRLQTVDVTEIYPGPKKCKKK